MKKKLIGLMMVTFLAACGFEPLYVEKKHNNLWFFGGEFDSSISQEMSQIKIETTGERFGQQIRNDLIDLLTPRGVPHNPKYRLQLIPQEPNVFDQALRNDITATRKRVEYTVRYTMTEDGKEIVKGNSVAYGSYDILANPYSMTISEKKVQADSAKIIANDIALRIGAYFHSRITNRGSTSDF